MIAKYPNRLLRLFKSGLILPPLALFLFFGCNRSMPAEIMLFDFEADQELDQLHWSCHQLYSLSPEHATHGSKSLKLELFPSDYPGLTTILPIKDWRGYKTFDFDMYNPSDLNIQISVRTDDKENYPEYNDRYTESFIVRPGSNHISIPLATMITAGTKRHLDFAHIHRLFVFIAHPKAKTTLFIDAVKLAQ
jgi:hypothetical protein